MGVFLRWGTKNMPVRPLFRPIQACYPRRETAQPLSTFYVGPYTCIDACFFMNGTTNVSLGSDLWTESEGLRKLKEGEDKFRRTKPGSKRPLTYNFWRYTWVRGESHKGAPSNTESYEENSDNSGQLASHSHRTLL